MKKTEFSFRVELIFYFRIYFTSVNLTSLPFDSTKARSMSFTSNQKSFINSRKKEEKFVPHTIAVKKRHRVGMRWSWR